MGASGDIDSLPFQEFRGFVMGASAASGIGLSSKQPSPKNWSGSRIAITASLPCSDTRVSRTGGVEGEALVALPAPHPPNISVRSRSKKRLPLLRGSSTEAAAGQFKVSRDTRGISADNNIEERAMTTY
jgi:hypothetical protein